MMRVLILFIFFMFVQGKDNENFWNVLNLHEKLIPWHIWSDVTLWNKCKMDPGCPVLERFLEEKKCFGMESNCSFEDSYSFDRIKCHKKSKWPQAKNDETIQKMTFWEQGDFGAAVPRMTSMKVLCSSKSDGDSYLECSDHLRICKGKNIFFNFENFTATRSTRYRNDIINKGQVGGRCQFLNKELLIVRADEKSYLQSWGYELEHFESYNDFRMDEKHCDVIFEKPTIIIKLDAAVNMYHHFCDFVNLYLSQHINGSFSQDVEVFWWDTFSGGFVDDYFGNTWKAFTVHKPHELINYQKKKVCFRNILLPLLARQRLGIYYNMPLIDGCQGSGLFHAFSLHLIHRLEIIQDGPIVGKVRITILQRKSSTRRIENINELFQVLQKIQNVQVQIVVFDKTIPFLEQIKITHNSDIFIGMHGAGLTHMLFLPEWAAVFEIFNCGDVNCYLDLARLKGIKYFTWKNLNLIKISGDGTHPTLKTPHKKFNNYAFDSDEFVRIVKKMIEHVKRHPEFVEEQRRLRRLMKSEL